MRASCSLTAGASRCRGSRRGRLALGGARWGAAGPVAAVALGVVCSLIGSESTLRAGDDRGDVRVVLISVDGLRPDAVSESTSPRIFELGRLGVSAADARSQPPTYTIPNHTSMLTGLIPFTHGFEMIRDPGDDVYIESGVPELLAGAGRSVGLYLSKWKLRHLAKQGTYDRLVLEDDNTSNAAVESFEADWASPLSTVDFAFVHITEPDVAGHADGWMSEPYFESVRVADDHVGRILDAIAASEFADSTYVLLTSDHGGEGRSHFQFIDSVIQIPFFAVGPGVPVGTVRHRVVGTHDCAPTVLELLDVDVPGAMEGESLARVLRGDYPVYRRGDATVNGRVDLSDAIQILSHLFLGFSQLCLAAEDVDSDGDLSIVDAIRLLSFLFLGGEAPPEPFDECARLELGAPLWCENDCP